MRFMISNYEKQLLKAQQRCMKYMGEDVPLFETSKIFFPELLPETKEISNYNIEVANKLHEKSLRMNIAKTQKAVSDVREFEYSYLYSSGSEYAKAHQRYVRNASVDDYKRLTERFEDEKAEIIISIGILSYEKRVSEVWKKFQSLQTLYVRRNRS